MTTNCRCDVSAFDLRRSMRRLSTVDLRGQRSGLELFHVPRHARRRHLDRRDDQLSEVGRIHVCAATDSVPSWMHSTVSWPRRSKIDVSTFEDRCVALRRSKVRAVFTQGRPSLVAYGYSACNVSYTLRYMFAYALFRIETNAHSVLHAVKRNIRYFFGKKAT